MIKDKILKNLELTLKKLNIKDVTATLEKPANSDFGDYSSSLPLKLTKQLKKNPMIIAEEIKNNFPKTEFIKKIEIVKPGFINFWIADQILVSNVNNLLKNDVYGKTSLLNNKKIIIEFTDPNPFKEFHIGHLYSNVVGESICRIFEANEAIVRRVCYQGDVGLHVAKSLWGLNKKMEIDKIIFKNLEEKTLEEKIEYLGQSYALGASVFEEDEKAKKEIIKLNKQVYDKDNKIKEIYDKCKQWSLDYFESIYQRLGTNFQEYYFESAVGKIGLLLVEEYLKKGLFEKSKGAVIFPGEKYGLHSRVFINSLGLPTYEAKELGLAPKKNEDWPYDESYIITANEINEYFKVLIKVLTLISPDLGKKTHHIGHGIVKLPEGKMSSRTGKIITGEWLLNTAHKKSWDKIQETTKTKFKGSYAYFSSKAKVKPSLQWSTAEIIGVGAIKYAFLKQSIGKDVVFNFDESINFEGNSGPYIQYAYVRCKSVLNKADFSNEAMKQLNNIKINVDESNVLRIINQFPEVVQQAAIQLAPNLIANYLYELAQKYNYFYQKNKILESEETIKQFRLMLTQATGKVIKEGLYLLGIKTVERM
ncbi:MAG: arginine--tRNA ligase [Patescibacteria group bacterium]